MNETDRKIQETAEETTTGIQVDGNRCQVPAGSMLLPALSALGIHVPSLCDHPSLPGSGACRLCVVEITHPDWRGWSGLVTSCLYPVEAGLVVSTRSDRVLQARRTLLELYLARCPESEVIRNLARSEGVDATGFAPRPEPDLCIQCGLCTRVCQDLGPQAIAPLDRGIKKRVGPRPDLFGEDCTGCLACAHICPTGEIRTSHDEGKIRIWNRDFPVALCSVTPAECRACGACEEVCPEAIPRVVLRRDGLAAATIEPARCTGCGICAGSCPTGAITQQIFSADHLAGPGPVTDSLAGQTVIYACSRSRLPEGTEGLVPVPCIGRVGVESILQCLARGADGVLLMCRDQRTCPYARGGAVGQERAAVTAELAAAAGLGSQRVSYVQPAPGPDGPAAALSRFAGSLTRSPLKNHHAVDLDSAGLDRALDLLRWLKSRPELEPRLPAAWQAELEPVRGRGDTAIHLAELPELDLLLSLRLTGWRPREILTDAVALLRELGIQVEPVVTAADVTRLGARRVIVLHRGPQPDLGPGVRIVPLQELIPGDNQSVGQGWALLSGFDPKLIDEFRFQLSPEERREIVDGLEKAAGPVLCESPYQLAQIQLLARTGSWQQVPFQPPVLPFSTAVRPSSGEVS